LKFYNSREQNLSLALALRNLGPPAKGDPLPTAAVAGLAWKKLSLDLNYTLDFPTRFVPLNRVSLGVRFNLGDQGRADREAAAEALYLQGLEAYARGELEAARQYWEATLKTAPRFEPAAEGLALIARSQALMSRIDEMQSLGF
jgi:hypothetical protein